MAEKKVESNAVTDLKEKLAVTAAEMVDVAKTTSNNFVNVSDRHLALIDKAKGIYEVVK